MLVPQTERLKFLVAFRPGSISPTLAAQQAATYQRHSGGRLLLNVVTGGESSEQRSYGDFLDKDDRYVRTGEFLRVVRALWRGETVSLDGPARARREYRIRAVVCRGAQERPSLGGGPRRSPRSMFDGHCGQLRDVAELSAPHGERGQALS